MPETIKAGDTISVHYTGKFEDGNVFDSSEGRDPLKFTVGEGQLIRGFDEAVVGMNAGDTKQFTVSPEEGYGEHSPELVFEIPRDRVPDNIELQEGLQLTLTDQSGNHLPAVVGNVTDETVSMDANHPLAGKTLTFDIEVVATGLTPDAGCNPDGCGSNQGGGCCSC